MLGTRWKTLSLTLAAQATWGAPTDALANATGIGQCGGLWQMLFLMPPASGNAGYALGRSRPHHQHWTMQRTATDAPFVTIVKFSKLY